MALGSVSDLRRSSCLLSKGCAAFRGRGHLEARTACRSETNMPLVLILGQSPRGLLSAPTRPRCIRRRLIRVSVCPCPAPARGARGRICRTGDTTSLARWVVCGLLAPLQGGLIRG